MEWDGEIRVEPSAVFARCLIDGCEFTDHCYAETPKHGVRMMRELLSSHRYLHHKDRKKSAQVNLVFADGVTA